MRAASRSALMVMSSLNLQMTLVTAGWIYNHSPIYQAVDKPWTWMTSVHTEARVEDVAINRLRQNNEALGALGFVALFLYTSLVATASSAEWRSVLAMQTLSDFTEDVRLVVGWIIRLFSWFDTKHLSPVSFIEEKWSHLPPWWQEWFTARVCTAVTREVIPLCWVFVYTPDPPFVSRI